MTAVFDAEVIPVEVDPLNEDVLNLDEGVDLVAPTGGIAYELTEEALTRLGSRVVADFDNDEAARSDWKEKAEKALNRAAQEKLEAKTYPWPNASNVSFPLLTVAALQFQARAYPAIVKNDEAVSVKVFGQPVQPDPELVQMAQMQPQDEQQAVQVQQAQQMLQRFVAASFERKRKLSRSRRVAEYLNYCLFYGMPDWEADTDSLLLQLPIIGAAFRKTFVDPDTARVRSCYVTAMNVVVPQSAVSLETTPRMTEIVPDVYPYQIKSRMLSGFYLDVELTQDADDDQGPRCLLEQYRYEDLDGDGLEEPYIVTVDRELAKVLRVEPGWTREKIGDLDDVIGHERFMPYTLYSFIPDPKGRFYPIGFGHLLDPISDVVNTTINQLVDAGHAQIAGGGFMASGLRLQGAGQTNVMRWRPGEYKTVNATGQQLQQAIYERTFPAPSAVAFQMLELMLGAAKEITATSDVITGQAPASAPVGTTLALIEQGLQVFTAIYKRVYRSLKTEFGFLYDMVGQHGSAQEYLTVVDDPNADFQQDFSQVGNDVVPVSDPTIATKMQQMARAQFLGGFIGKGLNDQAIYKRMFAAADIDDYEELFPQPQQPDPMQQEIMALQKAGAEADIASKRSTAMKNLASANKTQQEARQTALENGITEAEINALFGGLPSMEGQPGDTMGGVAPFGGGEEAQGPMGL